MARRAMTRVEDIEIHTCCQLQPRLVLLEYDHDSLGTSLEIRQSVTMETGPVVVQHCLGSTPPLPSPLPA